VQPHPSFGSPFAELHPWELESLTFSNPHPKPQPHPQPWLLAELSQQQQPCLNEKKKLLKETFFNLPCPWAAHRGVWGFLKAPWRLWSAPKAPRDLQVHQKAYGGLWGAPKGKPMPVRTQKTKWMALACTKSQVMGS